MNDLELKIIDTLCDYNENLSVFLHRSNKIFVYRSRFLQFEHLKGYIIIDEASPETADAKPLSVGEIVEIYFEFRDFRYIFVSKILEHTRFKIGSRDVYALKISVPENLQDGERREYFRIEVPAKPVVRVKFNNFKNNSTTPIMSEIIRSQPEEFEAIMVDISGGGFSIKTEDKYRLDNLEKGDVIKAKFKLKSDLPEMVLWSQVRNRRKYKETNIMVWGLKFMEDGRNKVLKGHRNKIMRYVVERQRQLMFK